MVNNTHLDEVQKSVIEMVERFTLTQLLVSSIELIDNLPEDEQDAAWRSVFLLIEGARKGGVLIAEA
jgi:hypothetical protein